MAIPLTVNTENRSVPQPPATNNDDESHPPTAKTDGECTLHLQTTDKDFGILKIEGNFEYVVRGYIVVVNEAQLGYITLE